MLSCHLNLQQVDGDMKVFLIRSEASVDSTVLDGLIQGLLKSWLGAGNESITKTKV